MVLDFGADNMAGCPSEEDLPECDCDVNRQEDFKIYEGYKATCYCNN